jgi:hypothetical protein
MPFPNHRSLIVGYLNEHLDVHVSTRVPTDRPDAFVRVLDAGGQGRINPAIEEVAFTVESWSNDETNAEARIHLIRSLLSRATGWDGHPFYAYREYGAPVHLPDESPQYRFTYTFSMRLRTSA